jgi:hypothetical protein
MDERGHVAPVQKPMLRACTLCHVVERTSLRSRTCASMSSYSYHCMVVQEGGYKGGVGSESCDSEMRGEMCGVL